MMRLIKHGLVCVLLLSLSALSHAETLLVTGVLVRLPLDTTFAELREPECGTTNDAGEQVICTARWQRYQLTKVTTLDGLTQPEMTVLVYADAEIAGPRLLELQPLSGADAALYGATYKALRSTTLFSGACFDQPLKLPDNAAAIGPTQIQEFGAAQCYLMPLWWAR